MSFENLYDAVPDGFVVCEESLKCGMVKIMPSKPPRVVRSFEDLYDSWGINGDATAYQTVYSKNGRKLLGCIIESDADGEQALFPCDRRPDMFNHYISTGRLGLIAVVYAKCN